EAPDAEACAQMLAWFIERGLLDADEADDHRASENRAEARRRLADLFKQFRDVEVNLPEPQRVPATVDGNGQDEHVFLRGNHKNAGPVAARRMLEAIAGAEQPPAPAAGSGRMDLAARLTDPSNPLVARVMVNRVWHHLLGRG